MKRTTRVFLSLIVSPLLGIITLTGQTSPMPSTKNREWPMYTADLRGSKYSPLDQMPAPQSGSPMTYMVNGKQYIIVAVSGGNYAGEYVAFALPDSQTRPTSQPQ